MNRYEKICSTDYQTRPIPSVGGSHVFTPAWNEGLMVGRTINGTAHLDVTNLDALFWYESCSDRGFSFGIVQKVCGPFLWPGLGVDQRADDHL